MSKTAELAAYVAALAQNAPSKPCPHCHGSGDLGGEVNGSPEDCRDCGGTGKTLSQHPDIIAQHALKLRRLATRHAWYCLQACNVGLTDKQETEQEKLEDKMTTHVAANFPGVKVAFQHDPRGATVKLILPDGRSNSFVGGYWCVPTSREW